MARALSDFYETLVECNLYTYEPFSSKSVLCGLQSPKFQKCLKINVEILAFFHCNQLKIHTLWLQFEINRVHGIAYHPVLHYGYYWWWRTNFPSVSDSVDDPVYTLIARPPLSKSLFRLLLLTRHALTYVLLNHYLDCCWICLLLGLEFWLAGWLSFWPLTPAAPEQLRIPQISKACWSWLCRKNLSLWLPPTPNPPLPLELRLWMLLLLLLLERASWFIFLCWWSRDIFGMWWLPVLFPVASVAEHTIWCCCWEGGGVCRIDWTR